VRWNQTYLLFGHNLWFSLILASLPIFTLLFLLGILRKPAWIAGLSGLAVSFALAIGAYHMPPVLAISAAANGVAFGLFPISWIVFWAIALFRVSVDTGQFEIIKDSIGRLTSDQRLQALLIAFVFGAFLEGAAGFGTPVAIAATMLIGLGFTAFDASATCLLANTAPVAFGSIGIPIVALAGTTGLSLDRLGADVGLICTPMAFIIPFYLIAATKGLSALSGIFVPTLLASSVFAGVQLYTSTQIGPQLSDILASLAAMIALILYLRFSPARKKRIDIERQTRISAETITNADQDLVGVSVIEETLSVSIEGQEVRSIPATSELLYAWSPYALLVFCVLLWGWKPAQTVLSRTTLLIKWPFLNDLVQRMPPIVSSPTPYHAIFNFNWLSAPGTACMVATLLSAICLKMSPRAFGRLLLEVLRQLLLPIVTVTSVLAVAFLMNYCGATATLGLAFSATAVMFPFFSALLGWVGVFLTGSDTSSNALFGSLQVVTATRLGLSPYLMAAANSAGGVMGKMISLQTIAIAAAATGLSQQNQTRLFRFALKHSIILATAVGCIVMLYCYVFRLH
jgi:lactate permease